MGMEMEADPNTCVSPDDASASGEAKACANCHTTKTPLWRGGPEGPKFCSRSMLNLSLCNACGIRYRKRRRQALGLAADPQEQQDQHKAAADPHQLQPKKKSAAASSSATTKKEKANKDKDRKKKDRQVTVELHVVGFGKELMLKQRRQMRRNKCMSEEERAAVLLMALSSGVIYAS